MKEIAISKVGGLNSRILFCMGSSGIAVLTSANIPSAVALPYTNNRKRDNFAARQYVALTDKSAGGKLPVSNVTRTGRLKTELITELHEHGSLLVLLRGKPFAILLPYPADVTEANRNIDTYLRL